MEVIRSMEGYQGNNVESVAVTISRMHGYIVNPQAISPIYTKVEIPSLNFFREKERER